MRWLLTYSDLITLLMAFFIVMYAMSQVDSAKYSALASALGRAMSGSSYINMGDMGVVGTIVPNVELSGMGEEGGPAESLEQIAQELNEYIQVHGLEGKVSVGLSPEGLDISFSGYVLFDLGKAYLRPDSLPILSKIADFLSKLPNSVGIAGSTDDLKIATPEFPSNWELSVLRATTVVRYFTETKGLQPDRFIALGYGEYHPSFPNDSEENRARNRRVDIIIYRQPPFLGYTAFTE